MYHYDPVRAMEELEEEHQLTNPVLVREMIIRAHPGPEQALELNRKFVQYQKLFGEAEKILRSLLEELKAGKGA